ncbi:hypothetical protein [Nocardioides sp. MH1]|uniref:hypothetical protein n=1 Tax=Nocardioides sp. MH1 TaxID=3242490 RepID=UPI00352244FE
MDQPDRPRRRLLRRFVQFVVLPFVIIAVLGGAFAGVWVLNERSDRPRAMYHDTQLMAAMQYDLLRSGLPGIEMSVDSDTGPVRVGNAVFFTLPGVRVDVEQRGDEYCVQGHDQYGDETEWVCVDGTGERPSLGAVEGEFSDAASDVGTATTE